MNSLSLRIISLKSLFISLITKTEGYSRLIDILSSLQKLILINFDSLLIFSILEVSYNPILKLSIIEKAEPIDKCLLQSKIKLPLPIHEK